MRVAFGVADRSRFLRRDVDRERERPRSLRSAERRLSLPSASFSLLRRSRSLDLGRSLTSLAALPLDTLRLRERDRECGDRDFDARLSRRRSPPLDDDDDDELDDDELDELDREPELCDDELLLDELVEIPKK